MLERKGEPFDLNKTFLKVLIFTVLTIVIFLLSNLCVYGLNTQSFIIISIGFIGLISYLFWRKAILFLVIWIMVSGAFRKWFFPEIEDVIYLFGHAIVAGAYIRYFQDRLATRTPIFEPHPINIFFLILFIWGIACVFNPIMGNIFVGILGLVVYFYFIPLSYIFSYMVLSKEQLIKLLKIFVIISVPLLILAIVQFYMPYYHPINTYVRETQYNIALAGGRPRVTSTFSFISGFAVYLSLLILICIYLLSVKGNSIQFTIFTSVNLVLAALSILMTGSRGPATYCLLESIFYFFIAGILNMKLLIRLLPSIIIVILFTIGIFKFTTFGFTIFDAFNTRASSSEDIIPRLMHTYTDPFQFFKKVGVYGVGIGDTFQGAVAFGHDPLKSMQITGGYEEEQGRIVVEIGFVGYVLMFLVRILVVKYFWDLFKKLKDEQLKNLALICIMFLLPFSFGLTNLIFDITSNTLYWYVIGFLFLLPKLDKQIAKARERSES